MAAAVLGGSGSERSTIGGRPPNRSLRQIDVRRSAAARRPGASHAPGPFALVSPTATPSQPFGPLPASGVVLAGGRASRFGGDKLATTIGGRTLLAHTVAAVGEVCREVVVVLGAGAPEPAELAGTAVRVVRDASPYPGPLVAFLGGLEVAREPLVVLVGGDMPALRSSFLRCLLAALLRSDVDAVLPVRRGRPIPMPSAVRLGATLPVARHVVASGERSLRGLFASLRTFELPEADWRPFDPEASSLLDVDRPGDLVRLEALLGRVGGEGR